MKVEVHTLNAFIKSAGGGNPAGVVLDADGLSEDEMLKTAAEVGYSETAFLQRSERADLRLRFFTPAAEVDLCGHATIAAYSLLSEKNLIKPGKYTQETKAGILSVEIMPGKTIYMNQGLPLFLDSVPKREIADSLNIPVEYIMEKYPAQIVSTGLRDILVPVNTLDQVLNIHPDFDRISEISKKYGAVGYHIFTMDTREENSTAHCRNFAPLYNIPEEAATGTSSGALGCYLYRYQLISAKQAAHLAFEQGYSMRRPSEILAALTARQGSIKEVKVGGTAQYTGKILVEL